MHRRRRPTGASRCDIFGCRSTIEAHRVLHGGDQARPEERRAVRRPGARVARLGLAAARPGACVHRAVHLAPDSAAAQNTLGTMLFALGNGTEAARALRTRDLARSERAYALNNLCYLSFTEGDECQGDRRVHRRADTSSGAHGRAEQPRAGARRRRPDRLAAREFLACGNRGHRPLQPRHCATWPVGTTRRPDGI